MDARIILVLLFASLCSAGYNLKQNWGPQQIIDNWVYFTGNDPTHGYVYYASKDQAKQWQYVTVQNNQAIIKSDSTTVSSGSGRGSVRISSPISFSKGLVIGDFGHMPEGMGTWPAFWTCTANGWPNGGEIDIIEGVNGNTLNQMTLHSSPPCTVPGKYNEAANVISTDCNANINSNAGCARLDTDSASYGTGFNNAEGGVYAMQWEDSGVFVWWFRRGSIPSDILNNVPNPANWGNPRARFAFNQGCSPSLFYNHVIVLNTAFCGDWAGSVYPGGTGACNSYVQNNPGAFAKAYWAINSIKLYQL